MQEEFCPSHEKSATGPVPGQAMQWSWQGQPNGKLKEIIPASVRLPKCGDSAGPASLACYTWHYGNHTWIDAMSPSIESWARRNSIDLNVWRQPPVADPSEECTLAKMLKHFLTSDQEWMIYMDADVMVHPLAPNPLGNLHEKGMWAMEEPGQRRARSAWAAWVKQHFQREVNPDYRYCNDGVWLADRATAEKFLIYLSQPMMPGRNNPYYFNLCLHDAIEAGNFQWRNLPSEWNHLPHRSSGVPEAPGWFYHCAGSDKGKALEHWQLNGFLPQPRPPVSIKPWPAAPEMENVIVMPFHMESDPWKGECMRFALRSIEKHWKHDWPLVVFGTERPYWLDETVFCLEPSYPQALLKGCSMARRAMWMNDDIFFLKDTTQVELETVMCSGDLIPELPRLIRSENRWARARAHITGRLHHEQGLDVFPDFSTHTPYLFEREHARKVFDHFGIWHKFPMELAYHGLLGTVGTPCTEKASMETRDDPAMRWLNIHDSMTLSDEFKDWLLEKFPLPSRWEKP